METDFGRSSSGRMSSPADRRHADYQTEFGCLNNQSVVLGVETFLQEGQPKVD